MAPTNIKAYIDGALVKDTSWPGNLSDMGMPLTFGKFLNYYWQGRLDDVRIYSRVLSASEILALYNLEK